MNYSGTVHKILTGVVAVHKAAFHHFVDVASFIIFDLNVNFKIMVTYILQGFFYHFLKLPTLLTAICLLLLM